MKCDDWKADVANRDGSAPDNDQCHRQEYVQGMRDDPCECDACNPTDGLADEEPKR